MPFRDFCFCVSFSTAAPNFDLKAHLGALLHMASRQVRDDFTMRPQLSKNVDPLSLSYSYACKIHSKPCKKGRKRSEKVPSLHHFLSVKPISADAKRGVFNQERHVQVVHPPHHILPPRYFQHKKYR
jgi:hypothetical protein